MPDLAAIRARLAAHKQAAPVIAVLWADTPTHERIDLFLALYSFYERDVDALLAALDAQAQKEDGER